MDGHVDIKNLGINSYFVVSVLRFDEIGKEEGKLLKVVLEESWHSPSL